jgi:lipoprotein-anchoring transpeptidase ErfK/SrfK
MRQRSFIVLVAFLAVLLAGAGVVYAYDSSHDGEIAKGVRVGGVDVGGMDAAGARQALRQRLAAPIERPLTVRYHARRFTLVPRRARLQVAIGPSVRQALARSREGNALTRTLRGLVGGALETNIEPRITYSRAAVNGFVERVTRAVDRPARDATVRPSGKGLAKVPARRGVSVLAARLRRDVLARIKSPFGSRRVLAYTRTLEPKVMRRELASHYPTFIIVDRAARQLRFYKHLKLARTYPIAVGQQGLETPAGLYHIQDKQVNPSWHVPNSSWAGGLAGRVIPPGPEDPLKARWMGFNGGAGIHGTADVASLGTAASHGCIRMSIPDVEQLYDKVRVGSPLYVA